MKISPTDVRNLIPPLECVEKASTKLSKNSITLGQADYVLEELLSDLDESRTQFEKKLRRAVANRILQRRTPAARCARLMTPGPSPFLAMDQLLEQYREGPPLKPIIDELLEEFQRFERSQGGTISEGELMKSSAVIRSAFESCLESDSSPAFRQKSQNAGLAMLTQKFKDAFNLIRPTSVAAERMFSVARYMRDNKANLNDERFCRMFFLRFFFRVTKPILDILKHRARCLFPEVSRVSENEQSSGNSSVVSSEEVSLTPSQF